jgi:hypothetical protein
MIAEQMAIACERTEDKGPEGVDQHRTNRCRECALLLFPHGP